MIRVINKIINYIPRESVEDMLNVRLYAMVTTETNDDTLPKESLWGRSTNEKDYPNTISMTVVEQRVHGKDIKKIQYTEDLLKIILNTFEENYKIGKCYKDSFNITENDVSGTKMMDMIHKAGKLIGEKTRMGIPSVALVPEYMYNYLKKTLKLSFHYLDVIVNPLEEYQNKIFIIRAEEKKIVSSKYHLLTDRKIENDRMSKINKILNIEPKEINYSILPVNGCEETVIVINIV